MPNVFSIDVEDWFHILDNPSAPTHERWSSLEPRVQANTEVLLEELARRDVHGTFFVLGWVARRHPELVRAIAEAGHEIASHGYAHRLVYEQTPQDFRDDLRRGSEAIHAACGRQPRGYRAPGFSITRTSLWALDVLREEGFEYDSSAFPALRRHGGLRGAAPLPTVLDNGLVEFPVSTVNLPFARCPYLGGGYLRLLPRGLILRWAEGQSRAGSPLILYLHPRDIDAGQPRLFLAPHEYFRVYVGLRGCLRKVHALLDRFTWTSFADYLRTEHPARAPALAAAR